VFALMFALTGFLPLVTARRNTRFPLRGRTILIHDWLMYISFFLFPRPPLP